MNAVKLLAVFISLAALARAESTGSNDRVIQLPPVRVEATRLPDPVVAVRTTSLDEVRARASLAVHIDMRRALSHSVRRLVANQRLAPSVIADKPKA
jgi:hypothetical protein